MHCRFSILFLIFLLPACGDGGRHGPAAVETANHAFLEGSLAGAEVTLKNPNDLTSPLANARTDATGAFRLEPPQNPARQGFRLVEVAGGEDGPPGADTPYANKGAIHALVRDQQLGTRAVNVSILTDIAWRYSRAQIARWTDEDLSDRLNEIAATLLSQDLDGDGDIDYDDLLAFDPRQDTHLEALNFDYRELLSQGDNGASLADGYRNGDDASVNSLLDAFLGAELSPYEAKDVKSATARIEIVPLGDGNILSDDQKISIDTDNENIAAVFDYPKSDTPIVLTATPKRGREIESWSGCDAVSDDLSRCTIAPNIDRQVVISFVSPQMKFSERLFDLGKARITVLGDNKLAVSVNPEDASAPDLRNLVAGDYITGKADGGFLRKVVSITAFSPTEYELETTEAYLEDVVEEGAFSFRRTMTGDDAVEARSSALLLAAPRSPRSIEDSTSRIRFEGIDGVRLLPPTGPDDTTFTIEIGHPERYDGKAAKDSTGKVEGSVVLARANGRDQVRAKGKIELKISYDWGVEIHHFKLKSFRFIPQVLARESLDLHVIESIDTHANPVKIGQLVFPKILLIGQILTLTPRIDLYVGMDGRVAGAVDISYRASQRIRAGVTFSSKLGLRKIHEKQVDSDFDKYSKPIGVATKGSIKAVPAILINSKTGPSVVLGSYIKLQSQVFGEQTSNYWKDQRCASGFDNAAWAGIHGEINWITTKKIKTKIGKRIVDYLRQIEGPLFDVEKRLVRWEVGVACQGPKKPGRIELSVDRHSVEAPDFSTEPMIFNITVHNAGEQPLIWQIGNANALSRWHGELSSIGGRLEPGTEELIQLSIDPTALPGPGDQVVRLEFRNLSIHLSNETPFLLPREARDKITGDQDLILHAILAPGPPPPPENIQTEKYGADGFRLSWELPAAAQANINRLSGYGLHIFCASPTTGINIYPELPISMREFVFFQPHAQCSGEIWLVSHYGQKSERKHWGPVITGDIIANNDFMNGMKRWSGVEHGAQTVRLDFAGQATEEGRLLVAATLGGTPYSGVEQGVRLPEKVGSLAIRYQLIDEVTNPSTDSTIGPPPYKAHRFLVVLEDENGIEHRLLDIPTNSSDTFWHLLDAHRPCLRAAFPYNPQEGGPVCTVRSSLWQQRRLDIAEFAGQYVTLKLLTQEDRLPDGPAGPEDLFAIVDYVEVME